MRHLMFKSEEDCEQLLSNTGKEKSYYGARNYWALWKQVTLMDEFKFILDVWRTLETFWWLCIHYYQKLQSVELPYGAPYRSHNGVATNLYQKIKARVTKRSPRSLHGSIKSSWIRNHIQAILKSPGNTSEKPSLCYTSSSDIGVPRWFIDSNTQYNSKQHNPSSIMAMEGAIDELPEQLSLAVEPPFSPYIILQAKRSYNTARMTYMRRRPPRKTSLTMKSWRKLAYGWGSLGEKQACAKELEAITSWQLRGRRCVLLGTKKARSIQNARRITMMVAIEAPMHFTNYSWFWFELATTVCFYVESIRLYLARTFVSTHPKAIMMFYVEE